MTTAQYRNLALDSEKRLAWGEAATYWRQAIAAMRPYTSGSALSVADAEQMTRRAKSCEYSARQEEEDPRPIGRQLDFAQELAGQESLAL